MMRCAGSTLLFTLWITGLPAQSPATVPQERTGAVTGHVLCADTLRPARLAQVKLVRVPGPTDLRSSSPRQALDDAASSGNAVETSLDGSFNLRNVKPGDYYLVVDKEGYLLPLSAFSKKDLADPSPEVKLRITRAVHTISVSADQTTQQDITLERGASVSGTVLYDDGSPASGIVIKLLVKDTNGKWVPMSTGRYRSNFGFLTTDDYGKYRIPGLPAGEYATEADLTLADHEVSVGPMPNNPNNTMEIHMEKARFSLPLYSGDVLHKPDAKPYSLGSGEARSGTDLVFPLAKLHKVAGQLLARDGHAVNAGRVQLLYPDDRSLMTDAAVQYDDAAFHLEFVPEGDFLLKVADAKDVTRIQVENSPGYTPRFHEESKTLKSYGDAEQPLLVKGDTQEVVVPVPELKPTAKIQ